MIPLIVAGAVAAMPLVAVLGFKKGREQGQTDVFVEQQETKSDTLALCVGAFLAYRFYKGR